MGHIYFTPNSTDRHAIEAVKIANEILSLYHSSSIADKKKSVERTKDFLDQVVSFVMKKDGLTLNKPQVKDRFFANLGDGAHAKWNELMLVHNRSLTYIKSGQVEGFGIDHNAKFIDWLLRKGLAIVKEENGHFADVNRHYLNGLPVFFHREDEGVYEKKGNPYGMMFIRNAYRAEMYARERDKLNDMYTPLILTRMAVEQYLKAMCKANKIYGENHEKGANQPPQVCPPSNAGECRSKLFAKKLITDSLSQEIATVLYRGNVNTHHGYASYAFAVIHGIELLKHCVTYFK